MNRMIKRVLQLSLLLGLAALLLTGSLSAAEGSGGGGGGGSGDGSGAVVEDAGFRDVSDKDAGDGMAWPELKTTESWRDWLAKIPGGGAMYDAVVAVVDGTKVVAGYVVDKAAAVGRSLISAVGRGAPSAAATPDTAAPIGSGDVGSAVAGAGGSSGSGESPEAAAARLDAKRRADAEAEKARTDAADKRKKQEETASTRAAEAEAKKAVTAAAAVVQAPTIDPRLQSLLNMIKAQGNVDTMVATILQHKDFLTDAFRVPTADGGSETILHFMIRELPDNWAVVIEDIVAVMGNLKKIRNSNSLLPREYASSLGKSKMASKC